MRNSAAKVECFKIQIVGTDGGPDSSNYRPLLRIACGSKNAIGEPTIIAADPFLFVKGDALFLFYEDKKMYHDGVISMTKTMDLKRWTKPVVVLKESCHLSYPWVFEANGRVYMIPETSGMKSIRLYEGNEDLTKFEYRKTILEDDNEYAGGFSFSDTSIHEEGGCFYLMTTVNDGQHNILKLYLSDRFDEGYVEHPASPICADNRFGRNAGSLFRWDGKLYRVAQDCEKRYGDNVNLLLVQDMTPTSYREVLVKADIIPTHIPFYREGGHQFNTVEFNGRRIIATDAKEYHRFVLNRILHQLGAYR